jgi:DMSO/TMAO reductase YedYZ molybdopterin-dependent catalytic subunit
MRRTRKSFIECPHGRGLALSAVGQRRYVKERSSATLVFTDLAFERKLSQRAMRTMESSQLSIQSSQAQAFAGLIVRERNPETLEFPFSTLNSFTTSNEQFFVRSHFGVPKLKCDAWRLVIEGAVKQPCEIAYDELLQMPFRTLTMTLECAGNSRIFLSPKVGGVQWELGAVSNAEWTGVPLAAVLKRAGVKPGAGEVVLAGADNGTITKEPVSPGKIHYSRSLPLAKALMQEVHSGLRNEWRDVTAFAWISVASHSPWVVWDGLGQVADANRCH